MPEDIVSRYIATKDPFFHSGALDHEHPILSLYVSRIEGEPESISGLSKRLTEELIKRVQ